MLPNMTGLRDLHWHIPIPPFDSFEWQMPLPIPLALLNRIPIQTRLHTSVATMDEPHDQARAFLAQLVDNQNLFSLSVHIAFLDGHTCGETMHILKQVFLSCTHLAWIPTIYVGPVVRPPHGIVDGSWRGDLYCGLGLSGEERPPPLEEFGLTRYPWGREPSAANLATGYPEKGVELQYWVENFDWSRLRRLNYVSYELGLGMAPKLTAPKEFVNEEKFDLCWDKTELITSLEQIPTSLEPPSIPSWRHINKLPEPILRHGETLRSLTIHCLEPWKGSSLITGADLVILHNGLHNLEELALDISRDKYKTDWPFSALDIIAGFACLQSLKLWFELQHGPVGPMPHVTVSAARQLLTYLRERNKKILRLELCSGAPSRRKSWTGETFWEMYNSIRLVCEFSLRDVDAADSFLRVTCPDLSSRMNAELNLRAKEPREGQRGVAEDAKRLLLEVALDGPLTYDEWMAWIKLTWARWEARQKAQQRIIPQLKLRYRFKRLVSGILRRK